MVNKPVAAGPSTRASLVDAIDHLLNRGAVLCGDATLSVAGVDLVYVGLNLLISSVETLQEHGDWPGGAVGAAPGPPGPSGSLAAPEEHSADSAYPEPGEGRTDSTAAGTVDTQTAKWTAPGTAEPALNLSLQPAPAASLGPDPEQPSDVDGVERPLARLVLTLVELLRQLVERQALRRMEGRSLSDEQIERMGLSLMALAEKMAELRQAFGLEEADLAIDLGPLGRLV